MFLSALFIWLRQAIKALAALFLFATLLPLALGLALGIPTAQVFGLISSTIVLQANAAFVGVGMGMHPAAVLMIMTLVEVGTVLAILFVCDAFAIQSVRVRDMLRRTEEKMQRVPYLAKYGAITLIILPAMPVVGLYSSAVIGWILRWDRGLSLLFITIGWVAVTVSLILVALGFVRVLA
ncbi:MAG: small multi-drug export protein [Methanoculleus bourgensis]|jgi:uncharacterized membrane protein|nr:small multi-drug export protein [Methanoculleus bourgensis]